MTSAHKSPYSWAERRAEVARRYQGGGTSSALPERKTPGRVLLNTQAGQCAGDDQPLDLRCTLKDRVGTPI